jgi:hypothetical protein
VTTAGGYASIQKRGRVADAQLALGGGGDTEAKVRQQKSEDRDATPDQLFKLQMYHLQHTSEDR